MNISIEQNLEIKNTKAEQTKKTIIKELFSYLLIA